MEEQIPLAENEVLVTSEYYGQGIVRLEGNAIDLHWLGKERRSFSFTQLVEMSRRGQQPTWVSQITRLADRIEAVFAAERAAGKNPYSRAGIRGFGESAEAYYEDMTRGTSNARPLRDLKADLARGRKLPDIYNTPNIRAALGLPEKDPGGASTKPGAPALPEASEKETRVAAYTKGIGKKA